VTGWTLEQIEAIAPTPAAFTAARPLAVTSRWAGLGADDRAVWGSFRGSGSEPYDTWIDHVEAVAACTCPSRRRPCKHALALLLLWSNDQVAASITPPAVSTWLARRSRQGSDPRRDRAASAVAPSSTSPDASTDAPVDSGTDQPPEPDTTTSTARDERIERMFAGLTELDRWLEDRMRTGLADPALARYATWDELAARLVDAQAGSLANRVRRLAGLVGASPDWHGDVLAEVGLLHLLAQAGRRLPSLPGPLADIVATAAGWQVRQADVLGGVPDTDDWIVAGRSDTREDRIEVRRHWLVGQGSGRWALVLSFAAYRQSLDTSLHVGTSFPADLFRYPGPALRALVGIRHGETVFARPNSVDIATACGEVGSMLALEPWLDRVPFTARAAVAVDGPRFALTDDTGSLPLLGGGRPFATLLAVSAGSPVDVTCEWTPLGAVPLAIHLDDRTIDVGPRADESFVSVA
jgi:hypothetical protein